MVGSGALGDGHADQRHHVRRHHGPGLHEGHELRRVLLRPALRDDRPVHDPGSLLLPGRGLHRLPVPGAPLRRAHPHPDEPALPPLAGAGRGRDALRPLPRPVGDPRLERDRDGGAHGRDDHRLRRLRRQPLGDLDGRRPDGAHLARDLPVRRRRDRRAPDRVRATRRPGPGPGVGASGDAGHLARPFTALHAVERARRRDVPLDGLLRVRSEPGPALPLGPHPHGKPSLAALQRLPQGPDAVPHPADGRARVRLLPLSRDAAPVEPGRARPARGGRRSSGPRPPAGRVRGGARVTAPGGPGIRRRQAGRGRHDGGARGLSRSGRPVRWRRRRACGASPSGSPERP